MSAREFFLAESAYLKFATQTLAQNGAVVVDALNNQVRFSAANQHDSISPDIVGFKELKTQAESKNSSKEMFNNLSSHIRVLYEDGEKEEFELILYPFYDNIHISRKLKGEQDYFKPKNTWLALDPDWFYLEEDEEGHEIWPITFPAISLEDPSVEINVTLERGRKIIWPESIRGDNNRLLNIGTNSILSEDDYFADYSEYEDQTEFGVMSSGGVGNVDYLAIHSLRVIELDATSNAKIQLYIGYGDNYNNLFHRNWTSVFDTKNGIYNRPKWYYSLNGLLFTLAQRIRGGSVTQQIGSDIFSGSNRRTFSIDRNIYETPDINLPNVNYYFTNMRTWTYIPNGVMKPSYEETIRSYGFPVALLTGDYWRFVLVHNRKKYAYTSARRRTTLEEPVWTFDTQTGNYQNITTRMDAARHSYGNSDRVFRNSGVRRVNVVNVNDRLNGGSSFTAETTGGHKYLFTKVTKNADWLWHP